MENDVDHQQQAIQLCMEIMWTSSAAAADVYPLSAAEEQQRVEPFHRLRSPNKINETKYSLLTVHVWALGGL